jgi:aspartate aminotransferase-like enzyme
MFSYNGVEREGYVMGIENGRFGDSLIRINEVWNDRDDEVNLPTGKLFRPSQIRDLVVFPRREA